VAVRLKLGGGAGGIDFDHQRLGGTGGHTLLESTGATDATDRFEVEVTGGASRITVAEVG
jgi:hypothetical protein